MTDSWCAPRWGSGFSIGLSSWGSGWSFGFSYSNFSYASVPYASGWCAPAWTTNCWRPYGYGWRSPVWCAPRPIGHSYWFHDPYPTPWRSYAWRPVCWTAPDPCSWSVCHTDPYWTPWWSCTVPTVTCANWYGTTPWTLTASVAAPVGGAFVYAPVSTVVAAPVVVVEPLPDPDASWTLLAEGFDTDARHDFTRLSSAEPADARFAVGEALALAFAGQTARASDRLRDAFAIDPGAMHAIPFDARLAARLEALERALAPLASSRVPSIDALLVLSACQSARGDLATAYFTASQARELGDRSVGTAESVAWLADAMRQRL